MNSILEYRKSIIAARKEWDKILEEGWVNNTVIDTKDKVLNRKVVSNVIREQQHKLGIYGGGVALLSNAEKMPMLLYAPKIQKIFKLLRDNSEDNIYDYEYLDTPYDSINWDKDSFGKDSNLNYFIDLLYFLSRKQSCPEYVNAIKFIGQSPYEYNFQHHLRKEYEVLHCSCGEIQFFILAWTTIVFFANKQGLQAKFSSLDFNTEYDGDIENWAELFKDLEDSVEGQLSKHFTELKFRNSTNDDDTDFEAIKSAIEFAQNRITENTKKLKNLHKIIEALQLNSSKKHFNEFSKYYQHLFNETITIDCFSDKSETEKFMIKFMVNLKSLLRFGNNNPCIEEMVLKLHSEARFPIIPYYYMMAFDEQKELKEHLVFPIWFAFSNDTQYSYKVGKDEKRESAVLHALYTIKPIWEIDIHLHYQNSLDTCSNTIEHWYTDDGKIDTNKSQCFENYLSQLITFFTILTKPIIDKEYYSKVRRKDIVELEKQAIKAAISQVMARNMSHNIGSHVIPHLITSAQNPTEVAGKFNNPVGGLKKAAQEFLLETHNYNRYIQERMELIATVSTTFPFYLKTEANIPEIQNGFKDLKVVCKGIVDGSMEIYFKDDLAKQLFHLPGGQIGIQLMYSFIEGVIRNCKKHSLPNQNDNRNQIDITFKITDCNEDYYYLEVVDLLGKSNPDRSKKTLKKIRELLYSSILENNELRKGGWGLLELKIASALLIGIPLESIDLFKDGTTAVNINGKTYPAIIDVGFYESKVINEADSSGKEQRTETLLERINDEDNVTDLQKNIGYKILILKPKLYFVDTLETKTKLLEKNVNKDSIVAKPIFTIYETCDFYIGQQTPTPLSNYRHLTTDVLSVDNDVPFSKAIWTQWSESKYNNTSQCGILKMDNSSTETLVDANGKIVFDDHGEWLKKSGGFTANFIPHFYQPHNNFSSLKTIINSEDRVVKLKLLEAIHTCVSVFDERIQKEARTKEHENLPGIKLQSIFGKMNIYIPDFTNETEIENLQGFIDSKDGNKTTFTFENHPILNLIKNRFIAGDNYVLIHHTILEIIAKQLHGENTPAFLNKIYKDIYDNFNLNEQHLIIISGLGLPSNLPTECFFLNLVTVQNLLLVMKSKFHLVQALKSLRPIIS